MTGHMFSVSLSLSLYLACACSFSPCMHACMHERLFQPFCSASTLYSFIYYMYKALVCSASTWYSLTHLYIKHSFVGPLHVTLLYTYTYIHEVLICWASTWYFFVSAFTLHGKWTRPLAFQTFCLSPLVSLSPLVPP